MSARLRLGAQGWQHPQWVGSFYADDVLEGDMLAAYAAEFDTVEVSDTFRGIPPESLLYRWRDAVPSHFRFALKMPQQVTHERRFLDAGRFVQRFCERVSILGERLGPLLLSMVPGLHAQEDIRQRFVAFISSLPQEHQWVVEFRERDWLVPEILDSLRSKGISVALVDGRWLRQAEVLELADGLSSEFAYVRWNRPGCVAGEPEPDDTRGEANGWNWEEVVDGIRDRVGTVYGYVSDKVTGDTPAAIRSLRKRLGQDSTIFTQR